MRTLGATSAAVVLLLRALTANTADWSTVACLPVDPPPEARYETTLVLDDFEATTTAWSAAEGPQQGRAAITQDRAVHRSGQASLRVDYTFIGQPDYEYLQLNHRADLPDPAQPFGFWLRHDGTPFQIRLRYADDSGEIHQIDLIAENREGWQFVTGNLDQPSTSWGGDDNHRPDPPLRLLGLVVDRPLPGFRDRGTLWIDDVALLRERPLARSLQVEVADLRFGNVYTVGEHVALRTRAEGDQIRWIVEDFSGRSVASGLGGVGDSTIRFNLTEPGYYACRLEVLHRNRITESVLYPCASLPAQSREAPSDFVGICTHFGQNRYPLSCMELMRRYGVDQFRDEMSWGAVEQTPGDYVLPPGFGAYLRHADELKMRPLLIFDYANRIYDDGGFPNSTEAIQAFARYAVNLARLTQGTVRQFEVWNEWIGGCGMQNRPGRHDAEAYGRLLGPTYAAVKEAFPDVTVVGIGGEYGAECADNIVTALKIAGPHPLDAWSIHPYRYPRAPESSDLIGEVEHIAQQVVDAGETSKAWITEIGYPTHRGNRGSDERTQARYLVRTLVLLQALDPVEKVFWYDFKDDGLNRDYNEHNFGLVHHEQFNCAPKPAAVALAQFIRQTGNAAFRRLRRFGDSYAAVYRRSDGGEVVVAWCTRGTDTLRIQGEVRSASDLVGAALEPAPSFLLTEDPLYLSSNRPLTLGLP